jgi:hypothetical protein
MIMKYVWQNVIHLPKYFKVKIDSKNYSNNYQTLWNIYTYVEYELIVLFKFHIQKIWFIWFHKKHLIGMFHSNQCKRVKKLKNCWKITLIWKVARIMLKILCQIFTLCVSQNARWNSLSQNNIYIYNILLKGPQYVFTHSKKLRKKWKMTTMVGGRLRWFMW